MKYRALLVLAVDLPDEMVAATTNPSLTQSEALKLSSALLGQEAPGLRVMGLMSAGRPDEVCGVCDEQVTETTDQALKQIYAELVLSAPQVGVIELYEEPLH